MFGFSSFLMESNVAVTLAGHVTDSDLFISSCTGDPIMVAYFALRNSRFRLFLMESNVAVTLAGLVTTRIYCNSNCVSLKLGSCFEYSEVIYFSTSLRHLKDRHYGCTFGQ